MDVERSLTEAPTLWNALPDDIRPVELLETFKSKLKTHLFRQLRFNWFYIYIFFIVKRRWIFEKRCAI